jgi:hypothetical protein
LRLRTSQVVNDSFDVAAPDVEMEEGADDIQIIEAAITAGAVSDVANDDEDVEITEDELPKRVTFLE